MDFNLSEIQLEVRDLSQKIFAEQCSDQQLRQVEGEAVRYDESLWQTLGKAGLLGIAISGEYGGMDSDYETLCLLAEEAGRCAAPIPVVPVLVGGALTLQRLASPDQCRQWLPGIASGQHLVSSAWFEPGYDQFDRPQTSARSNSHGWLLNGVKYCVPYAAQSERILLAAAVDDGIGLFLLDPRAEGVTLTAQQTTCNEPQYMINIDNAVVPTDDVLLTGSTGIAALRWISDRYIAAVCSLAVGITDKMMRLTAAYTSEREQFGVKIATFQAVSHRTANCYIDNQCLNLATQQAVSLLNSDRDAAREVLVAKAWAGDVSHRVSFAAQHLHGGTGVDRDYELFRYCLWAKYVELTAGHTSASISQLGDLLAADYIAGS